MTGTFMACFCIVQLHVTILQWDTANTEIKVSSAENLNLSKFLSFKPVVGKNIAMHALSAARTAALIHFCVISFNFIFFQIFLSHEVVCIRIVNQTLD